MDGCIVSKKWDHYLLCSLSLERSALSGVLAQGQVIPTDFESVLYRTALLCSPADGSGIYPRRQTLSFAEGNKK